MQVDQVDQLSKFSKLQIVSGVIYIVIDLLFLLYFLVKGPYIYALILLVSGLGFSYFTYTKYLDYKKINTINTEVEHIYKIDKQQYRTMPWILRLAELLLIVLVIAGLYGLLTEQSGLSLWIYLLFMLLAVLLIFVFEIILKEQRLAMDLGKLFIFKSGIYILGFKYARWDEITGLKIKNIGNNAAVNIRINKRNVLLEIDNQTLNILKEKIESEIVLNNRSI